MEGSSQGGRFMLGSTGGRLGLETPMHPHQHAQMVNPSLTSHNHHHMKAADNERQQPMALMEMIGLPPKRRTSTSYRKGNEDDLSEDDDPEDGEMMPHGPNGTKISPWQRMKWTDNVVRLLIAVVAYVGDDGTPDGVDGHNKRKSGVLQKKGKWRTVSKIMISKGCHVSPQQCEDKFNDLNKRYKKLNDILGRGTCCQVVENPSLMESMPHLSSKAKDEVRKVLSSKHLFYQEMCAYHNGQRIPNCPDLDLEGCSSLRHSRDNDGSDEDEEAEENGDSEDDDDESENEDDNATGDRERNVERNRMNGGNTRNSFEVEMAAMFRDDSMTRLEKKRWIKKQMFHLQEQSFSIMAQSFQLEKQRLKWLRYRSKKDMELERLRIENKRMRLENEQSVVLLEQKELEVEVELRHSEAAADLAALATPTKSWKRRDD